MKIVIEFPDNLATPLLEKVPEETLKTLVYSYMLGLTLGAMSAGNKEHSDELIRNIANKVVLAVEILN